jgi:Oxidoreductase family, NAD-binding Rossmann fold
MSVTRREFVTKVAGAGAAVMIVPRHVLGRGFQAPSDLVNVATVGFSGMGAENTRAVMGQNVVAICDCDLDLLDGRLDRFIRTAKEGPPQKEAPPAPAGAKGAGAQGAPTEFRDFGPSKAQLAANARWPDQDGFANLQRFVEQQIPRVQKYQDYREMLDKQKDIDAVIIATPDHMHAVQASNSMDAGKHV